MTKEIIDLVKSVTEGKAKENVNEGRRDDSPEMDKMIEILLTKIKKDHDITLSSKQIEAVRYGWVTIDDYKSITLDQPLKVLGKVRVSLSFRIDVVLGSEIDYSIALHTSKRDSFELHKNKYENGKWDK